MIKGIHSSYFNGGAYILTDNIGLIEDLGCAFTSLTGYSKSDLYRKNISDIAGMLFGSDFHMNDLENNTTVDLFLISKSWEAIEVSVSMYQLGDTNQTLYFFKQKPNFILNSEQSFVEKLIEDNNMGIGLYSCPDYRLLQANQKYLDYLQDTYNEENFLGRCLASFIPDFKGSDQQSLLLEIARTGGSICNKEIKITSYNGEDQYWNHSLTPITEDDQIRYIVIMLTDVTEIVMKGKCAEEKYEQLKQKNEIKDELLLLISHELKTPLSIITSCIQTMEIVCKNELSDKVRKYINKIRQSAYRQMKLVNNILDNTRMSSGHFCVNRSHVDLVQLSKTIIESILIFAERKGIEISFSSTIKRAVFETDVELYERILLNLLSNAVKFTPEGKSIDVKISQTSIKGKKKYCIQVKDSGIGIPSDKKELIFERFGRVDKSLDRYTEGTGIGLYLVKMLVSLMEGDIKLESKEGVGSTFSLLFPVPPSKQSLKEPLVIETPNEQLLTASLIEFSDIYYGT